MPKIDSLKKNGICGKINSNSKRGGIMTTQEEIWKLHNEKLYELTICGLKNGQISIYDDELIQKLRTIYYGGIPASILLLSNGMSNGYCYDRALLMARAFLDTEDDIQLVYASVDSIKLNPLYINDENPLYADHCFLERITKEGKHLIYDTTAGLIYDKDLYWKIENPKVRKINKKSSIEEFVRTEEELYPEDIERDKYSSTLILPIIETTYGRPLEMYSKIGNGLLQREIEHYKNIINYESLCEEVEEDMKKLGFI